MPNEHTREARESERDARSASRAQRRTPQLSRERIIQTALALVDREGLGALSMRRLGKELGVDPMAVYYYLPNKDALLDAIVEAVMAEIDLSKDLGSASTEDRVMHAATQYRDTMLAHANALPLVLQRGPHTPGSMRPVEYLIGVLREAGLSPSEALAGMNAIAATVRGTVAMVSDVPLEAPSPEMLQAMAEQLPADEFPYLREATRTASDFLGCDFEFGIRALTRGLLESAKSAE